MVTLYRLVAINLVGMWVGVFAQDTELSIEHDQYKRVHQNALRAVVDGRPEAARSALVAYMAPRAPDPESYYALAAAHAHLGEVEGAVQYLRNALGHGLPPERLVAGSRNLLGPLREDASFQGLLSEHATALVHGPMIGDVRSTSAVFWVRMAEETTVTVELTAGSDFDGAVHSGSDLVDGSMDFTARLGVEGLAPDTEYRYRITAGDGTVVARPEYRFRTEVAEGTPGVFRVAFGGGAGYVPENERMWDTIRGRAPSAFLFLGDNIYPDDPERPAMIRYSYYRRQARPEYRAFLAQTPAYAIWDDHDFGVNDCWGGPEIDDPPWKRNVWRIFRENWVNPGYGGGEEQPGCWFRQSMADVDFFHLDGRYYRTDPNTPGPSMLGPAQLAWLLRELGESEGTFKVIVSPVPMASGTKPGRGGLDTWDGYEAEREAIFGFIEANRIEGVFILSADRHRSDVWRIPRPGAYDLWEFESSRLTNQHVHAEMEAAVFSYNRLQSFGQLDFDTSREDPEVVYTIVNIDGEDIHSTTLRRSQLVFP